MRKHLTTVIQQKDLEAGFLDAEPGTRRKPSNDRKDFVYVNDWPHWDIGNAINPERLCSDHQKTYGQWHIGEFMMTSDQKTNLTAAS